MARLHEYQAKRLLERAGITIPRGKLARTPREAYAIEEEIGGPVVVKGQAWVTGRAGRGLIRFANDAEQAEAAAAEILGQQIEGFQVEAVLVEEKLDVAREFYAGVIVDDREQAPLLIFSAVGGTGIEEIAARNPEAVARRVIDVRDGFYDYQGRELARTAGLSGKQLLPVGELLSKLAQLAQDYDARSAEINPIVLTEDGEIIAADCRMTVDDYGVYRHPELEIEVAREFNRPATWLEKVAWEVERNDYRGTFYFIQMTQDFEAGDGVIGFHGAGGGGSMMSMDALLNRGYQLADFVDTSGNPPASKVYRAARIIFAQGPLDGYFASGSGVASQEQYHSARGLVKAFLEQPLDVPAIIRLGGNAEEQAIAILQRAAPLLPAPLEGYGKDDSPDFCARRLDELIHSTSRPESPPEPIFPPEADQPYRFATVSGMVTFDHAACRTCKTKICVETCVPQILQLQDGVPVLNITSEQAAQGGCTECLACQIECFFEGARGGFVDLPIAGLSPEGHGA
ncbi:MAG: acetate--CoA ligase family protein [Anaerolineales bacterium]